MSNTRGSLFMVLAMAAFSVEDMLIKAAAKTAPVGLILALFGLGGMLVFMLLTRRRGERILHPAMLAKPVLLRAVCEAVARMSFALAISLTALSSASAILQAAPLITIIGAMLFFGEKIDAKKWIAVCVGLFGVLLIIRPGFGGFDVLSLFAVAATLGFAGRDLATRAAPKVLSNVQLGVYGFFVLIPTGLMMLVYSNEPPVLDYHAALLTLGAIGFGVIAYNALTIAMRSGDVAVVTPFRYTRLIFAMILGIFVFGETPDALSLIGSFLIVVSGVYALLGARGARGSDQAATLK